MTDRHTVHQSADGTRQHVQASTDGQHDITLQINRRDTVGELIEAWRQSGLIARFNEMQRGTSPAATLALILASYVQPMGNGCYMLPDLDEDTLRASTGLGRASYYRASQLLRAAGIMGPSKIPGRWMIFDCPESNDRHTHTAQSELFIGSAPADSGGQVSPGARAGADSAGSSLTGRARPGGLDPKVSPGARARADSVSPGRLETPEIQRASYSQKTSCQSVLSDDVVVIGGDGSEEPAAGDPGALDVMRDLLRGFKVRNADAMERAVRVPGLTPDAVRWCINQARIRAEDHPRKQPGLAVRMIEDGDWQDAPAAQVSGSNAGQNAAEQREREAAEAREREEHTASVNQAIDSMSTDQLAELMRVAIENAPNDFIRRRWKTQPVPPTDRLLRSEVFKLEAERMRRTGSAIPITDEAGAGSPVGSPAPGL